MWNLGSPRCKAQCKCSKVLQCPWHILVFTRIVIEPTPCSRCCFAYTCSGCLLQSEAKAPSFLVSQIGDNLVMRGVNALRNPGYANNIFWPRPFRVTESTAQNFCCSVNNRSWICPQPSRDGDYEKCVSNPSWLNLRCKRGRAWVLPGFYPREEGGGQVFKGKSHEFCLQSYV